MPMKIITALYSDSPPTKKANVQAAVTVPAGKRTCVAVNGFHEGYVAYVGVAQASGTNVDYTVDLYTSVLPFAVGDTVDATDPAGATACLYEAIPQQSATSGNVVRFRGGKQYSFTYADNEPIPGQDGRKLYLVITPTSSGDTTKWDVVITLVNELKQ